ncbi:MAG: hypothetical protein WCO66_02980 [Candidatus Absconditabacteria bacterium]
MRRKCNVLIIGSLQQEPTEKQLKFLDSLVAGLLEMGFIINNSNGQLLGQYITAAVLRYALGNGRIYLGLVRQFVPLQRSLFPKCMDDFGSLSLLHKEEMISKSDFVISIGGCTGTAYEVELAKAKNKIISFVPQFGGYSKDQYPVLDHEPPVPEIIAVFFE